jgi:hypothetical protein
LHKSGAKLAATDRRQACTEPCGIQHFRNAPRWRTPIARVNMTMGWGAVLRGDATDIDGWQYVLKGPFDPWVEVHGPDTILRSKTLDSRGSAHEVRDHAIGMISRLNGALALSQGARPVSFGGVVEFTSDGRLHRTVFAEIMSLEGRDKMRASGVVCGPDGQPLPATPQRSEVQGWMAIAEIEGLLEDALVHFGRADDWFDIYKCLECLFGLYGGKDEFYKLMWESEKKIDLIKWTADSHRHAKRARPKQKPPPNPMKIEEAQNLLAFLLRRALEDKQPN